MAEIILFKDENIKKITEKFEVGNLVAFPTDTVFGLGASIERLETVRRLYTVKQRAFSNPSQLLIADLTQLSRYVIDVSHKANFLIKRFWPGPLTIIFPASLEVPHLLCRDGKVAIRTPGDELLCKLIKKLDCAIVSSSCNFKGESPPQSFEAINPKLLKNIDVVLDGKVILGKESTIVDATGPTIQVLREGAITKKQLEL